MRILLLGAAAVALSGCSWIGASKHKTTSHTNKAHGVYAQNGDCCKPLSNWNLEAAGGADFIVGGDVFEGSNLHAALGGVANEQSMKDIYDRGYRAELGGSKMLTPNRKLTLMGSYAKASGGDIVDVGTYGGATLAGAVSDYERYGIEAGLRQYFNPTGFPVVKSIRPYVEGKLGAAKIQDIELENATYNGAIENGGTIGLYEGGWVPTGAALVGIEAPIFKRATLGVETGIRYTGAPKSDQSYFDGAHPLSGINRDGSSLTVPLTLRGRYRF